MAQINASHIGNRCILLSIILCVTGAHIKYMTSHTVHVARFARHRNGIAFYLMGNLLEFPMLHLI